MSDKFKTLAILFSGGTDSTLAVALEQVHYDSIHLLTFDRLGLASTDNSKVNAKALIEKFDKKSITHHILNFDKAFKDISYDNYISNTLNHGFMNLSTCGLCKLSMHIQAIIFCKEKGITFVADGANKGMDKFPAQMKPVIKLIRNLYLENGITYYNPVFKLEHPDEGGFLSIENMNFLKMTPPSNKQSKETKKTTGQILYDMGLAPMPNIKGSQYDRKRQPRCFQFVLFKIYVEKYFLSNRTYEEYVQATTAFFESKIATARKLLSRSLDKK